MALCFSAWPSKAQTELDPNQVYSTGNIVQPTISGSGTTPWVNGVYQDQLTCWGLGDPGYCGPNAIVRPGGNINFSYGSTYLYQQQAIAAVLPNSGTGLQVSGFNFGFTAKNGNGWDDGRTDSLTALVRFWDTTGGRGATNIVERYEYNLNNSFNWTSFNFSETFTTPHAASKIGQVQYGFLGRDNNGWAGPYGPEIYGVNFSLRYSVDTCSIDPTSSPSCPGYLDAILKMIPQSPVLYVNVETPIAEVPTVIEPITAQVTQSSTTGVLEITPSQSTPIPLTASTPVPSTASSGSSTSNTASTSPSERSSASGPSLGSILNIVRSEQSRISGVETTAVQQANETAAAASSQAQQQAESVAASAVAASQAQQTTQQNTVTGTGISTQGSISSGLNFNSTSQTSVVSIGGLRGPEQTISLPGSEVFTGGLSVINQARTSEASFSLTPAPLQNALQTFTPVNVHSSTTVDTSNTDQDNRSSVNFTMSPIKDYLDEKSNVNTEQQTNNTRQLSVKRNVAENEAAGGITLTAMAKQPPGYELYQMGMKDNAFYPPKEIYKSQKVVDNVRLMRGLTGGSDAKHQQMVDQQYELRN